MPRLNIEEFYRELDATNEHYVRRKMQLELYTPAQVKHVKVWLGQREFDREQEQAKTANSTSGKTGFWTMVGAMGDAGSFVLALILAYAFGSRGG